MYEPLVPLLYPERILLGRHRSHSGRYSSTVSRSRIPQEHWSEVAERASDKGLRSVAAELGVSHETIRKIVNRVGKWESRPEGH
jgi:hypothetical protein